MPRGLRGVQPLSRPPALASLRYGSAVARGSISPTSIPRSGRPCSRPKGRCSSSPARAPARRACLTHRGRAPDQRVRRQAERDPRDHVHEQGRGEMRERLEDLLGGDRARDLDPHLPRRLRPDPPPRGAAARLPIELHDLRPGRPDPARRRRASRSSSATRSASSRAASTRRSRPRRTSLVGPDEYRQRVVVVLRPDRRRTSYELYQRRLFASNAVDFDDLLFLTVAACSSASPRRARSWQKAFRYVLVDEYQDTNHAQYRLLQLLAEKHQQPLRRRRSGPVDLRLPRRGHPQHPRVRARLPGTRDDRRSSRTTARRTRSSARANAVIANNRERKPKDLWSELGEGEPVRVIEVEDEHAEARFVAAEIARSSRRTSAAARSRSSTGRTRSRACSRTCSCARAIAVPGDRRPDASTSAPRSRT